MALLTADVFSETLQVGTSLTVVLPQSTRGQIGVAAVDAPADGWPVLYLLHGLSDDHSAWLRYTSIERYAREAGIAVVMPAVGRSFYANEVNGHPYWDWVSVELPQVVEEMFRVSTRPEDTWVAGLSMGGYGALKLGLRHPERFAGVASLSGAVDLHEISTWPERTELFDRVFGGEIGDDADLFALVDAATPPLPPVYLGCGTEDQLHPGNQRFAAHAAAAGLDVTTDFRPGEHEWGLWDTVIRDVIAWLPRSGPAPASR